MGEACIKYGKDEKCIHFSRKTWEKRSLWKLMIVRRERAKMDHKEIWFESVGQINLAQDRENDRPFQPSGLIKAGEFLNQLSDYLLLAFIELHDNVAGNDVQFILKALSVIRNQ